VAGAAAKQRFAQRGQRPDGRRRAKAWGEFFWQHRNGLIDDATRARLQNGGEAQAQWILSQLYSAFSGVSGKELQNDPLMLMRGSQLAMAQNGQKLRLMDGWLVTQDEAGNYWYLLHGELAGSSFDMQQTHRLVTTLNALQERLKARYPQAQLLSRGTVFYSDYASQQAKRISRRWASPPCLACSCSSWRCSALCARCC
jgi:predicted exporter